MANRFLNNITINDSYTLPSADGTADQLITTDGAGQLSFIDPSTIAVGESEQVHIACKNTSGVAISKGDPVYITGTVGTSFIIQIAKADASDSAKMPAVGLAETDLAINAEGFVIVSGVLKNITTDPLSTGDGTPSSNDTIYVKVGGGLTRTKPTGAANLIQNVGKVGRVQSTSAGSIAVSTIMRTNDVPNLNTGKIWVGSSTYTTESGVVHLDETNGRMGIGTASPAAKLDIDGIGSSATGLRVSAGTNTQFSVGTDGTNNGQLTVNANSGTADIKLHSAGPSYFNGGNVGIGTATPTEKLTVNGNILLGDSHFIGNQPTFDNLLLLSSTTENIVAASANDIYLNTGATSTSATGNTRLYIRNSDGNVGIGTTSPSYKLDVNGIGRFSDTLRVDTTTDTAFVLNSTDDGPIYMAYQRNGDRHAYVGFGGSSDLFYINNEETTGSLYFTTVGGGIYVNSNGNVGIGTTSPTQKLHVAGSVRVTGAYYDSNNSAGTSGQILSSTATGTDWVSLSEIQGVDGTGTANYIAKWSDTDTITNSVIYDNGTNVGIGTTSPTSLLTLESSGTSPYPGIDIKSTSFYPGGEIRFLNSAGTEVSSIESFNNPGVSYLKLNYGSGSLSSSIALDDGQLIFYTAGGERMRVDSSGRVGIGTTSPNQKLTIKGTDQYVATEQTNYVWGGTTTIGLRMGTDATAGVLDFRRWTGTATNHGSVLITQYNSDGGYGLDFRVDALSTNSEATSSRMFLSTSGEVGIGTRSPGTKLDVIGEGRFSGRLYTNSSSTSSVGILGKAIANGWAARYDSNNNNFSGFFFDINNQAVIIGRNASGTITNWIHASGVSYFNGGNIGIGTTNPGKLLELSGGANVAVIRLRDTTSNVWDIQNSTLGKLDFIRGGTNVYMRIDQGGNVGINTTTPQAKLDVNGAVRVGSDLSTASSTNVGAIRYIALPNESRVDMVMQTGASTYAWVNIVTNTW